MGQCHEMNNFFKGLKIKSVPTLLSIYAPMVFKFFLRIRIRMKRKVGPGFGSASALIKNQDPDPHKIDKSDLTEILTEIVR
jgi:hypothetical protein